MTEKSDDQVLITWNELKAMGWPYCKTHTVRKMEPKIEVSSHYGKETRIIDNPDPFPKATKLGWHSNSPLVWVKKEVIAYFKRHGINI